MMLAVICILSSRTLWHVLLKDINSVLGGSGEEEGKKKDMEMWVRIG